MKSMKKVLALGLALAMAVTAVPVTSAQAATVNLKAGKTVNKTYYAGSSHTLKLSGVKAANVKTKTWKSGKPAVVKVSNATKTSAKISCLKKGTSTVTATLKMKNGKTKKFTCKVTVKAPSITISEKELAIVLGSEPVALKVKAVPASAKVTYTSDKTDVAEVDAKGVVTAKAAGEAVITATLTNGTVKKSATVKVTVTEAAAELTAVTQKSLSKFELTFSQEKNSISINDVVIKSNETGAVVSVKSATVDSKDKTKVIVETQNEVADGKKYTVTVGEKSVEFDATDAVVEKIAITPTTIEPDTATKIEAVFTAKNDVEIGRVSYGATSFRNKAIDFTIDTTDGITDNDNKLILYQVNGKAEAKVVYHSLSGAEAWENGEEKGLITEGPVTITAMKAETVAWDVKYSRESKKYEYAKNGFVAAGDYAYASIQRTLATGVTNDSVKDYTFVSSNEDIVTVTGIADKDDGIVSLQCNQKGSAAVRVLDENGTTVHSFPITVVAARQAKSLTLSNSSVNACKATTTVFDGSMKTVETKTVSFTVKDQYGEELDVKDNNSDFVTVSLSDPASTGMTTADLKVDCTNKNITVDAGGKNYNPKAATYKVIYETAKYGKAEANLAVYVKEPGSVLDHYGLEIDKTTVDPIIKKEATVNNQITATMYMYDKDGYKIGVATGSAFDWKLEVGNTSVVSTGAIGVGNAANAIIPTANNVMQCTINVNDLTNGGCLADGYYKLTCDLANGTTSINNTTVIDGKVNNVTVSTVKTFTVKNTQPKVTATVNSLSINAGVNLKDNGNISITYDGKTYDKNNSSWNIIGYTTSNETTVHGDGTMSATKFIKKIIVVINDSDKLGTNKIRVAVDVNKTITVNK